MSERTVEALPGVRDLRGLSREVVMVSEPNGSRAEAVRALRTHVVAQHINLGRRALAVCAPSGGVGCSFVAANLAIALAQIGLKTLLVDGDLRAPSIDKFVLPGGEAQGLRQCLGGDEPLGTYLHRANVLDELAVLFAGGPAPNAQELIGGDRFKALMEGCLRDFDITVVDTPPANLYADARRISSVLGYSVVVARRNLSLVHDIKTLVGELEVDRAEVVGTVLNGA